MVEAKTERLCVECAVRFVPAKGHRAGRYCSRACMQRAYHRTNGDKVRAWNAAYRPKQRTPSYGRSNDANLFYDLHERGIID